MTVLQTIHSIDELESLYGPVNPISLSKETPFLTPEYRRWIDASRFFAIASSGPEGLDCSPRGDSKEQLFQVLNDTTVMFPDRRGNNRMDTLRNIVADPQVALLFLIPGINETLRIIGDATISTDPELIDRFEVVGKKPITVIVVNIRSVYFQCARALSRANLWDSTQHISRGDVPTAGQMTKAAAPDFDAETYDSELPTRQKSTLY